MSLTEFRDLTFVQLLWVFISLAGMIFWAALVSDQARNLTEGSDRLDPTGQAVGKWLRARTPLQLQWIIIGVQVLIPLLAYVILAIWFDTSLRGVDRGYDFIRDLVISIVVGKIYYQLTKGRVAAMAYQYVMQNTTPASPTTNIETNINAVSSAPAPVPVGPVGFLLGGFSARLDERRMREARDTALRDNLSPGEPMRLRKSA